MGVRISKAFWALVCAVALGLAAQAQGPNKWAVVVGISQFKNFKPDEQLQFTDADAQAFFKFIRSSRGRDFPESNIKLVLNTDATQSRVKTSLGSWLPRSAKPDDIVYIFIATHGMVEKEAAKAAYLVTYDADPEDLYTTALPMSDLGDIISTRLAKAGRIVFFTDACHAGKMSEQSKGINRQIEQGASKNTELIGLMASRPTELSQEGKQFCGGHGAFTCFLLKGMDGAADADKDKTVTVTELIQYVQDQVPKATSNEQHPREFGSFDRDVPLAFVDKAGADLGFPTSSLFPGWPRLPDLLASLWPGSLQVRATEPSELRRAFDRAVKEGRLLAPTGQSAWDLYQRLLQAPVPQPEKEDARDSLAIALEDEGQKILVAYLRGDATPLSAAEYHRGADLFSKASDLTPDFPKLKARARFCDGRALVSEGKYMDAESALKESIAIDPDGAYSYNALGLAYLSLRRYNEAIQYFQSAEERAPKWAYPHYNRALAYTDMGRLQDAEREYKDAIERGPNYSYLHNNLGGLYLRMNRQSDAEKEFRRAIELAPNQPYGYNMLGGLYRTQGKLKDAEAQFRRAIEVRADMTEARINLAGVLMDRGDAEQAIRVLDEARKLDMRNADLHRYLGQLLLDRARLEEAENEFVLLQTLQPNDPTTFELLGDVHSAQKRFAEAVEEYRTALQLTTDPARQSQIKRKLDRAQKQAK